MHAYGLAVTLPKPGPTDAATPLSHGNGGSNCPKRQFVWGLVATVSRTPRVSPVVRLDHILARCTRQQSPFSTLPRLSTQTGSSSTPVSSSLRDCPFPPPRTPARLPIDRPTPPSSHPRPPRNVLGRDPDARRRVCRLVPAQKVQARLPRRAERGQDLPHHPFREFVLTLLSRLRLLLREHEPTSACAACPDPKPRLFAVERMPRRTRCRQLLAHQA